MVSETRRAYNTQYWLLNKNKRSEYKKLHYTSNLEKYMLQRARVRAKDKGLSFNLTLEDIIIPAHCPILGIELTPGDYKAQPHLDRIIPSLGYVKGNVRVISGQANRIKTNATPEEIQKVANFLKGIYS